MRRARWLLLAAILAILASVGATYFKRKDAIVHSAPAAPPPLEAALDGRFGNWCYERNERDKPKVSVCAKKQRQVKEPSVWELEDVELKLYRVGGKAYDLVKGARAEFDLAAKTLYSEGEVEIQMAVAAEPNGRRERLLRIRASGVRLDIETGKAATQRAATFEFDQGAGSAAGAEYDPNSRELVLKSKAVLDWRGKREDAVPLRIEAAEAVYRENESTVTLAQWSKLTRGALRMEAGGAVIRLEEGEIREAEVEAGRGVLDDPGRRVDFGASRLRLGFGEGMTIRRVEGRENARIVSNTTRAHMTVNGDRLDLAFDAAGQESILTGATATGRAVAEAAPLARPGMATPETRTLRSETIRLGMRPGGREIDWVETGGPGTLDFTPNRGEQAARTLRGEQIRIAYGADNRVQSVRSTGVTTRSEPPAAASKPGFPATTSSREFTATFDAAANQLARIEQTGSFEYQEGDRRARGDRAVLDQAAHRMTLDGGARVWDSTGSASADHIELDQNSGDYVAEGQVATTRQPDKQGASSAMLSHQEALQGRARRLTSANGGRRLRYEGRAVTWQGANRVQADRIEIDRDRRMLEAHGEVVSQFVDRAPAGSRSKQALLTVVRAPDLEYFEETRVAHYRGGVALDRPGLQVDSRELRAFLKDSSSDSSLDRAVAEGAVKIVGSSRDSRDKRTRTGLGERAEYFAGDQKVVLEGGEPRLIDSQKGTATGRQLIWFVDNDRLLVNGEERKPAVTSIRKK